MPIVQTQGVFSTGRDCTVVLIGPFGRVDLPNVTSFEADQVTAHVTVDRLDGVQMHAELPKGWQGSIECERGSNALDVLTATGEEAWMVGGSYQNSTMFQYVRETGGATTVFAFDNVAIKVSPGGWRPDAAVKQKISFSANRRRIV